MFLAHTQRRTTVGRTPLDKRSGCRRDLYLTTHNTHNRRTSIPWRDSKLQYKQARDRRLRGHWERLEHILYLSILIFIYFSYVHTLIYVPSYWACTDPDAFLFWSIEVYIMSQAVPAKGLPLSKGSWVGCQWPDKIHGMYIYIYIYIYIYTYILLIKANKMYYFATLFW